LLLNTVEGEKEIPARGKTNMLLSPARQPKAALREGKGGDPPRMRASGRKATAKRIPPILASGGEKEGKEKKGNRGKLEKKRLRPWFEKRGGERPREKLFTFSPVGGGGGGGGGFLLLRGFL